MKHEHYILDSKCIHCDLGKEDIGINNHVFNCHCDKDSIDGHCFQLRGKVEYIPYAKPTPEPEEFHIHPGETSPCVCKGKPKSKVPEKLVTRVAFDKYEEKINEILDYLTYLKEKEGG